MTISTTRAVERCEKLAALGSPPSWWRVFKLRRWLAEYRAIMAHDIGEPAEMWRAAYTPGRIEELANRAHPTFASLTRIAREQERGAAMTAEELAERSER